MNFAVMGASMPTVNEFLAVIQEISQNSKFDCSKACKRLAEQAHHVENLNHIQPYLTKPTEKVDKNTVFDGVDCATNLSELLVASTACGLADLSEQSFSQCVDKGKAIDLSKKSLAAMMPALYGDHLNGRLKEKNFATLDQLAQSAEFVQAFNTRLESPDAGTIIAELLNTQGSSPLFPDYSLNVLFANEYFRNGGKPYTIVQKPPTSLNLPDKDPTHFTSVLHIWSDHAKEAKVQDVDKLISILMSSASTILAPKGHPDATTTQLANSVCPDSHPSEHSIRLLGMLNQKEVQARGYAKTLSQELYALWTNKIPEFTSAIKSAVATQDERIETGPVSATVVKSQGTPAAGFITENSRLGLFKDDKVKEMQNSRVSRETYAMGMCFAPGTGILTASGTMAIESIKEDIEVVTSLEPLQYGRTSDELVRFPGAGTTLYGFNNEEPFFTANHAFFTTTGPRAIDPVAARTLNPWLDVGRLEVGDVLLKATRNGYEKVAIKSIPYKPCPFEFLYTLHLREGLRSYHANGYFAYLNYPEVTLSKVATLLRRLSKEQKQAMLIGFKELTPVFTRYGAHTIMDILDRQLEDDRYLQQGKFPVSATQPDMLPYRLSFMDLKRTWTVEKCSARFAATFTVYRGALYIDGAQVPQECVRYDTKRRLIAWSDGSRAVGVCHFYQDLFTGNGYYRTGDDDWASFSLTPTELNAFCNQTNAQQKIQRHHIQTFSLNTSVAALQAHIDEQESLQVLMRWNLQYDSQEWVFVPDATDDDTAKAPTGSPAALFEIQMCIDTSLKIPQMVYRVPMLDQIRKLAIQEARKKFDIELVDIPSLYEAHPVTDHYGRNGVTIELSNADVVSSYADAFDDSSEIPCLENLTFEKLGLPAKLPFLFQRIDLLFDVSLSKAEGAIRAYDANLELCLGTRYAISSIDTPMAKFAPLVAAESSMPSAAVSNQTLLAQEPEFLVATSIQSQTNSGTELLAPLALEDLDLLRVSMKNSEIASRAQRLIFNAMKYYMDTEARQLVIKENEPDVGPGLLDLPNSLGKDLETSIAEWIKTKYAPAYVGLQICSIDDKTRSQWQANYTKDDHKRMRYFWEGKGKGCLSTSYEYTRLNEIATREASIQLAPRLRLYINDGGEKWAKTYFDFVSTPNRELSVITSTLSDAGKDDTELKRICNLLQVLQPIPLRRPNEDIPKPYSVQYAQLIYDHPLGKAIHLPYVGVRDGFDNEYTWLVDAMEIFCRNIYDEKPGFDNDVCKKIREHMQELESTIPGEAGATTEARVAAILTKAMGFNGLFATAKSLFSASKLPGQPGNGWSRAISIGKGSLSTNNIKLGTVKGQLGMGLLSLAMVGLQMYFAISHWSDFKPEDKMQMIMCFIQGAAQALTFVGGAWKVFRANNAPIRLNRLAGLRVMQRPLRNMPRGANQVGIQMIQQGAPGAVQRHGNAAGRHGAVAVNRAANLRAQRQGRVLRIRGPPRQPVRAAFSYSGWMGLLNACFFLISIGLFISIMWQLVANWNDFDPLTRTLMVAQAVFMGIGLIIELFTVLGSFGVCLGAAAVCAWLGPIFLLVVIALGVALLIWGKRPISPLEKWIKEKGAPSVQNLPPLQVPKLKWSSQPDTVSPGSQNSVIINGTAEDSRANIASITVSFTAGSDDKCLFKTDAHTDFVLGPVISPQHCVVETNVPNLDHHILVTDQQHSADEKSFSITWKIVTQCRDNKSMSFAKDQFLKYTLTGTIAAASKFTVPVVEQWNDDRGALTDLIQAELTVEKK